MLIYNVPGQHIRVKREGACWLVFRVDLTECRFSRLYDIIIPDEMPEEVILDWLDDLFHETVIARYPGVQRVE